MSLLEQTAKSKLIEFDISYSCSHSIWSEEDKFQRESSCNIIDKPDPTTNATIPLYL